jgi:hypothetical protein
MAYRVSDALQDRWPSLPYAVSDGSKETSIGFSLRGLTKYCDLLESDLSADDQIVVLRQCGVIVSSPDLCEGENAWRLVLIALEHLEKSTSRDVRLGAGLILGCVLGRPRLTLGRRRPPVALCAFAVRSSLSDQQPFSRLNRGFVAD